MAEKSENNIFVNKEFDPTILLHVFRRTWYWFPLIFAVFFVGAFLVLRYTKPIYESDLILQVIAEDQGADVLDIQRFNETSSLSKEIELLNSEFLFEIALKRLNVNVSHFAKGEFLTEEKYHQSSFNITPYELKDSSLCGQYIYVFPKNEKILISYNHNGKKHELEAKPDEIVENEHFKIVVKLNNPESFNSESEKNQLYFVFNDIQQLARKLLSNLTVNALNPQARTIKITYKSNNSSLSRDIVGSVAQAFFQNDEKIK